MSSTFLWSVQSGVPLEQDAKSSEVEKTSENESEVTPTEEKSTSSTCKPGTKRRLSSTASPTEEKSAKLIKDHQSPPKSCLNEITSSLSSSQSDENNAKHKRKATQALDSSSEESAALVSSKRAKKQEKQPKVDEASEDKVDGPTAPEPKKIVLSKITSVSTHSPKQEKDKPSSKKKTLANEDDFQADKELSRKRGDSLLSAFDD